MKRLRVHFVLSADFGEYVTAAVFSRGQPFDASYSLPKSLFAHARAGAREFYSYETLSEVEALIERTRPDVVVLASGYLFPINRLASPEALAGFVSWLRSRDLALATTDPWLAVWRHKPDARIKVHSVRQGGVDAAASAKMMDLQRYLQRLFEDVSHLFAVPLGQGLTFFNPAFAAPRGTAESNEWLFVLSKEDFVFLAGFDRANFLDALHARIDELLAHADARLRFIGPPELGRALAARWAGEPRVEFLPFCDFDAFEAALRRARIVAYWNVLSSSLLYCLYHRVPPIFFGKGHQAQVCEGLYEHALEHVYGGRPPVLLDMKTPLGGTAGGLVERYGLERWLDRIAGDFARLAPPGEILERVRRDHARA